MKGVMNLTSPPRGMFTGKNIVTPNILGYYRLRDGYAELSEGRGINNEPIFGVTVRPDPNPKRSQMFHSRRDAEAYIRRLS